MSNQHPDLKRLQEEEKKRKEQGKQILIEDATMASFGLNNTSEVKVKK